MNHRLVKSIFHSVTLTAMAGTAAVAATPLSVPNGSFEQGAGTQPEAWVWKEPSDSLQAEWTEGIAHQGKRAIKVRMPGELGPGIAWRLACTTPVAVDSGKDYIASFWLKAAAGLPLETPTDWGFGKPTIYWDADLQKELIIGRSIHKYRGASRWPIPAYRFVPVDLLGDWREELLEFTDEGELRIHFSTIPAVDRRVCLMEDPIYRRDIAMCAMAYHRPAMLSYCPAARSRSKESSSANHR